MYAHVGMADFEYVNPILVPLDVEKPVPQSLRFLKGRIDPIRFWSVKSGSTAPTRPPTIGHGSRGHLPIVGVQASSVKPASFCNSIPAASAAEARTDAPGAATRISAGLPTTSLRSIRAPSLAHASDKRRRSPAVRAPQSTAADPDSSGGKPANTGGAIRQDTGGAIRQDIGPVASRCPSVTKSRRIRRASSPPVSSPGHIGEPDAAAERHPFQKSVRHRNFLLKLRARRTAFRQARFPALSALSSGHLRERAS